MSIGFAHRAWLGFAPRAGKPEKQGFGGFLWVWGFGVQGCLGFGVHATVQLSDVRLQVREGVLSERVLTVLKNSLIY